MSKKMENTHAPKGWSIGKLKTVISRLDSGVSVNSHDYPCDEKTKGILKTSCVSQGKFIPIENKEIIDKDLDRAKLNPKAGEILISRMNTPELVGEVGYIADDMCNLFVPDRLWQTTLSRNVDGKWLSELLSSSVIKRQIRRIATGTSNTMKNISKPNYLNIKILIPSYKEQKLIGEISLLFDKQIKNLNNLRCEKLKVKEYLAHELLLNKLSLDGFDGKWSEVRLGDIVDERVETNCCDLELLSITSTKGVIPRSSIDGKDNSSKDKDKYKRICPMDIGYNTMRMWQGVSGVSELEGIVSPAYTILKPRKGYDSYFLGYLFKLPSTVNLFRRYSQGMVNDTLNLKYKHLKSIKVKLPLDINEQREIVNILRLADKEVELIDAQIVELERRKKSTLELLLSGKLSVIEN